jgi:hypothetical protein
MNVLRHQNISGHDKTVPRTHRLELSLEDSVGSLPRQQRLPAITTEGQEMKTAALLVTDKLCHDEDILQSIRWSRNVVPTLPPKSVAEGWGTHFCEKLRFRKTRACHPPITTEGQEMKTTALLVTDKLCHDENILQPIRWSRFMVPTLPPKSAAEGWGTHFCEKLRFRKTRVCHPPLPFSLAAGPALCATIILVEGIGAKHVCRGLEVRNCRGEYSRL